MRLVPRLRLPSFALRAVQKLGLDGAIVYFFAARSFTAIATPTVLFLVTQYLSPVEQGFYFTFYSLVSLSLFFELGLGIVLTNFAAHEYSSLSWEDGHLVGPTEELERLSTLLKQSLKWYGLICVAFAAIVLPAGYFSLAWRGSPQLDYAAPWALVVIFFSLGTATIPVTSVLDGCGQISNTQKMRFLQALGTSTALAITLILGGKLYAVAAEFAAAFFIFLTWAYLRYFKVIKQLLLMPSGSARPLSWRTEILPMQFRSALYAISAYFQGYIIVPLVFQMRDPMEAGQIGMTMRFTNAIYSISVGWTNVRAPQIAAHVGAKNIKEAINLTKWAGLRSLATSLLGVATLAALILVATRFYPSFSERLLSISPTIALASTVPVSVFLTALITYLRAHKIEPYGFPSVVVALVNVTVCLAALYWGSVNILAYCYAANIWLFVLPYYVWIFIKQRRLVEDRQQHELQA